MKGAIRKNFIGMKRKCPICCGSIIVTEQMYKRRTYTCSKCHTKKSVEWARENREKKRLSNRLYQAKIPKEKVYAKTVKYRMANPEKKSAHQAVQTAVRNGTLIRNPCELCGNKRSHAHHDDYTKPLKVIWLCSIHHTERHKMLEARKK